MTLSNYDLAPIVNGFPGDPIEMRSFDYCFQEESILKSWIAVGFLPMTRNAINDPKVRRELNDGDTADETNQRIELFFRDYRKAATDLKRAGFNDEALDIEPPVVEERDEITEDEEKQIQSIIKNKAINSSGKLFKLGIHIANCKVVLEALRRIKIMKDEEDKQKALKKRVEEGTKERKAVIAFEAWKASGSKKNVDGKPVFAKADDSKNVVKFLIPILAPEERNVSQYTSSVKKSVERLMQVAGGTTWEREMDDIAKKSVYSKDFEPSTTTDRDNTIELGGGTSGLNPVDITGQLI